MKTINEVISALDQIIETCKTEKSPLGYFPVLYNKVTKRVKLGIENKEFEDNNRMEILDILFAKRYIDAWNDYRNSVPITNSWKEVFEAEQVDLLVMQHILLGINAHINLDLGIAAADTVSSKNINDLEGDFKGINDLLSSMIDDFQDQINKVSPLFRILDKVFGNTEEKLVQFSINIARKGAWKFTKNYAHSTNKPETIKERDESISKLGQKLKHPRRRVLNLVIRLIYLFEKKDPASIMKTLES